MSAIGSVFDLTHFPTFATLPGENDIDLDYYTTENGYYFKPSKHWCLLAEIVSVEYFIRLRLILKDTAGKEFPLAFYLEDREQIRFDDFKVGCTMAILYAHKHGFLDMTTGIRQEDIGSLTVIPRALGDVAMLADSIRAHRQEPKHCDSCAATKDILSQCKACLSRWYCDKTCQKQGWQKGGHKVECSLLRSIKDLLEIQGQDFEGFRRFPLRSA